MKWNDNLFILPRQNHINRKTRCVRKGKYFIHFLLLYFTVRNDLTLPQVRSSTIFPDFCPRGLTRLVVDRPIGAIFILFLYLLIEWETYLHYWKFITYTCTIEGFPAPQTRWDCTPPARRLLVPDSSGANLQVRLRQGNARNDLHDYSCVGYISSKKHKGIFNSWEFC